MAAAPAMAVKNNTARAYGRRKGRVPIPDRAAFIAMIVFAAMFIPFIFLMSHLLGKGGTNDTTVNKGYAVGNQDQLVKMWKPRTIRRIHRNDGLDATENTLKATIVDKESGRTTTNNNDEQASSIRVAKAKKIAKVNNHSSYHPKFDESELGYDIYNCPPTPPHYYPKAWKATEVLTNWNPNDVTTVPPAGRDIYQGLCVFDYQTQYGIAKTYRDAEKPLIIRNDPNVMAASTRWNDPNYLLEQLPDEKVYTERSPVNHFMFYNAKHRKDVKHWTQPRNDVIQMAYREWLERAWEREALALSSPEISARVKELREERMYKEKDGEINESIPDDDEIEEDNDTEKEKRLKWYYLRVNGWLDDADDGTDKFIFDELPFFDPRQKQDSDFYFVDPKAQRGINCRFGMRGIVAENHFDLSRNMIALLGGERRYIIGHPSQCKKMALYSHEHPSGRHSSFDWSNAAEWDLHPEFKEALVSEVVMQAGDVLYLPTAWFHYIVNLSKNIQCNIRSGIGDEHASIVNECGFHT